MSQVFEEKYPEFGNASVRLSNDDNQTLFVSTDLMRGAVVLHRDRNSWPEAFVFTPKAARNMADLLLKAAERAEM
jgi:hypothetical protein